MLFIEQFAFSSQMGNAVVLIDSYRRHKEIPSSLTGLSAGRKYVQAPHVMCVKY